MDQKKSKNSVWDIGGIALIFLFYWLNLTGTTPHLVHDSVSYIERAAVIRDSGFQKAIAADFPAFEPGYPFFLYLISLCTSQTDWVKTVPWVQALLLAMSAFMVFDFSRVLVLSRTVRKVIFVCVAVSPALLLSALSVYSEVLSVFCLTGGLYCIWRLGSETNPFFRFFYFLFSSLLIGFLILTKAAFFYIAAAVFLSLLIYLIWKRQNTQAKYLVVYIALVATLPFAWMYRNQQVFGTAALAGRASVNLAAHYLQSQENYSLKDWGVATVAAISETGAEKIFGDVDRFSWSYKARNAHEYVKGLAQAAAVSPADIRFDRLLFGQLWSEIWQKGMIRFLMFSWFEVLGLLFFEGCVVDAISFHASWLQTVYSSEILRALIHVGLSLFYLAGVVLFINRSVFKQACVGWSESQKKWCVILLSIIFWSIAVYSCAIAHVRYLFPVAPMYILLAVSGWFSLSASKSRVVHVNQ